MATFSVTLQNCNVRLTSVQHVLNVRYKTYIKHMIYFLPNAKIK